MSDFYDGNFSLGPVPPPPSPTSCLLQALLIGVVGYATVRAVGKMDPKAVADVLDGLKSKSKTKRQEIAEILRYAKTEMPVEQLEQILQDRLVAIGETVASAATVEALPVAMPPEPKVAREPWWSRLLRRIGL